MQALCSKFDNWGTGHKVIEKAYIVSLSPHIFSLIEDIILFWHLISLQTSSLEIHGVCALHLWIFSFKASNSPMYEMPNCDQAGAFIFLQDVPGLPFNGDKPIGLRWWACQGRCFRLHFPCGSSPRCVFFYPSPGNSKFTSGNATETQNLQSISGYLQSVPKLWTSLSQSHHKCNL